MATVSITSELLNNQIRAHVIVFGFSNMEIILFPFFFAIINHATTNFLHIYMPLLSFLEEKELDEYAYFKINKEFQFALHKKQTFILPSIT